MDEQVQARFSSKTTYDLPTFQAFQKINTYTNITWCISRMIVCAAVVYMISKLYIRQISMIVLVYSLILLGVEVLRWFRNRNGGLAYKQMLHSYNDATPIIQCSFQEDTILTRIEGDSNARSDSYGSIVRMKETKDLLILMTDLRMVLLVCKQNLTGGTREELIAFLRERCPKLKKGIQRGVFGRIVQILVLICLSCCALWSAANLLGIPDLISGKLTNNYSYQEMAEKLQDLDITISRATILEIEAYDAQYEQENGEEYYKANPYASKVFDLLTWEGEGTYNDRTWKWTPSRSGVYWFDTEVWNPDSMYADFFTGLSAMHTDLAFTDVLEDYSNVDSDEGTGTVGISFTLDSVQYQMEAEYMYDWFDTDILYEVGRILAADQHPKDLYFSYDGQCLLLYYGTQAQVTQLERFTGLTFFDTVNMVIGH